MDDNIYSKQNVLIMVSGLLGLLHSIKQEKHLLNLFLVMQEVRKK